MEIKIKKYAKRLIKFFTIFLMTIFNQDEELDNCRCTEIRKYWNKEKKILKLFENLNKLEEIIQKVKNDDTQLEANI